MNILKKFNKALQKDNRSLFEVGFEIYKSNLRKDHSMNEERRKRIANAVVKIEEAVSFLEQTKDEEQDAFDNMPEGLQQGEKGQAMESAIQYLEDAIANLESAKGDLDSIE